MTFGSLYDLGMHPLETWGGLARRRAQLIPQAAGAVLEVGAGSGANLPFYRGERVTGLHLLDLTISSPLARRSAKSGLPLKLLEGDAQALPFADATFDTVVFTLVFCSVNDPGRGLAEIHRVLRPGGRILFLEHGLPENRPRLQRALQTLTPVWSPLAGGCHLNRNPLASIRQAGFTVAQPIRFARGLMVAGIGTKG
jgi:SAM-dependent methyltransferase